MSYGTKKKRIVNGHEVSEETHEDMVHDELVPERKRPTSVQPEKDESWFQKIKKKLSGPNLGETITKQVKSRR